MSAICQGKYHKEKNRAIEKPEDVFFYRGMVFCGDCFKGVIR